MQTTKEPKSQKQEDNKINKHKRHVRQEQGTKRRRDPTAAAQGTVSLHQAEYFSAGLVVLKVAASLHRWLFMFIVKLFLIRLIRMSLSPVLVANVTPAKGGLEKRIPNHNPEIFK
jgi:hypothetical protein